MLARMRRQKARDCFTDYLEGRLSQRDSAWLELRLAEDTILRRELEAFQATVRDLHGLRTPALPDGFADDVAIALALEAKPLRLKYGDLLDGHGSPAQLAALRAEIAADQELAAEFALLEAALAEAHRFPAVEAPAGFGAEVRRRLAAERRREVTHYRRVAETPLLARPKLAWACAAALFLFGIFVGGQRLHGPAARGGAAPEMVEGPRPVLGPAELLPVSDEAPAGTAADAGDVELEVVVQPNADGTTPALEVKTDSDGSVSLKPPPGSTVRITNHRPSARITNRPRVHRVTNGGAPARPAAGQRRTDQASPGGRTNPAPPPAAPPSTEGDRQPLDEAGVRTFRIAVSDGDPSVPPPGALNALPPGGETEGLVLTGVSSPGFE